jgi:hypothetical protein
LSSIKCCVRCARCGLFNRALCAWHMAIEPHTITDTNMEDS